MSKYEWVNMNMNGYEWIWIRKMIIINEWINKNEFEYG